MDLEEIKSRINPQYQDVRGTESYERKWLCDEIERLRHELFGLQTQLQTKGYQAQIDDAVAENERLRSLLQNGSPVVEGTIQHMAMEIAALKKELAEAHAETDSVVYARDKAYEEIALLQDELRSRMWQLEQHLLEK